ncbi:zinc-binding alcohol dehydrogenase family protein [Secundilactobacillus kimchicus]|nr:zinc-binding alcohol dehydrogenase family protein [Secundilactobacillus kimchicus]
MEGIKMVEIKAVQATDAKTFEDVLIQQPAVTDHGILVEVSAVSVNPVDTKLKEGLTAPKILGYDAVGVVAEVGPDVTKFKVGDRVYYAGSTQVAGSNQEKQLVDERLVSLAPERLTDAAAAAMPLTTLTAYELLFEKMGFTAAANANSGATLLVVNGAGGVGSILTQLAHWAGLTVLATSSPKNFDWLKNHGVDHVLDYHDDLIQQVHDLGFTTVDGVALLLAPDLYFDVAAALIRPFGHIGSIVGRPVELPMYQIKNKAASFDFEYMFAKSDAGYRVETQGEILAQAARLFDAGVLVSTLTTTIDAGISASTLTEAHATVSAGHMVGKLVISGGVTGEAAHD